MAGARQRLTKKAIAEIEPTPGRQRFVWDSEVRGFGVRVAGGGAKAYIMQRQINGKTRRLTIGPVDDMAPEAARRKAARLAAEIAEGVDPVAEQEREAARAVTLREAFAAYKAAPVKKGAGRGASKRGNTLRDIDKAARRFADWLDKPVAEITGGMVKQRHAEIAARSPAQANQACRYLRAALNHAIADSDEDAPVLARNPVDRLNRVAQWAPVPRATGHIPDERLGDWVEAVQTRLIGLRRDNEIRDALLFLLLTGARISEVLGDPKVGYPPLRWSAVDLERGVVVFEGTKNRSDHELPLPRQLVELLEARRSISQSECVFADRAGCVPVDLRSAYARIEQATGLHVTAHDLRRTFASVANRLAIPAYTVKLLVNHTSGGDVTQGYVQVSLEDRRAAMQAIADYVLSPERREGHNIVRLDRASPQAVG
jgi:integrase